MVKGFSFGDVVILIKVVATFIHQEKKRHSKNMTKNPMEDIFNMLKGLGQLQEYKDYADYRERKYGISKKEGEEKQEEINEEYQEFKDNMPPEEREQYRTIFGD
jgi:hypothetical protein